MLSRYVPCSFTLPPAPVNACTIFVPDVMPEPLNVWPVATAPDVIPVTVKMLPEIEPVNDAPTKFAVDGLGPIVY